MESDARSGTLKSYVPILDWLPLYPKAWFKDDLAGGLTAAAVVIPQAMAYASIAGLPVEVGLYTALVPMLVYALFGSSRPLSVSTTSTISLLTAAVLALVVDAGDSTQYLAAASTLALLCGVFLILGAILRLGYAANFISIPVLTGFKAGIGVVIFVGQLGKVLGISVPKGPFLQTIMTVLRDLTGIHWLTFALALVTLGILILLPRLSSRLSAPLCAVAVGIAASAFLGLEVRGVQLVGNVPGGLPGLALPSLSLMRDLWPAALGIALMSFTESIASARAFVRHGEPPADADQELLALGLANVAGSLFQAYPAGGGASQTAVNSDAGARTQLAEVVTAGTVAVTLLFLAPLISLMPQATLGALVLIAAAGLIKPDEFRAIARIRRIELWWAITAFLGVIVLGTLQGIVVAVALSLASLIYAANHPPVYALARKRGTRVFRRLGDHPDDETFPGLLMVRIERSLHFASAPRAGDKLVALIHTAQPDVLLLECSAIPDIEYTALQMMIEFEENLRRAGIILWLAALNPEPLHMIRRTSLGDRLGRDRMFFNPHQALERYLSEYQSQGHDMAD